MCSTVVESDLLGRACGPRGSGITSRTTIEIGVIAFAGEVGTVRGKRGVHIEVDGALVDEFVGLGTERGGWRRKLGS